MARKFSLPEVAALSEGESVLVRPLLPEVRRKVNLYAARNGKHFAIEAVPGGPFDLPTARVTRLPDPEPQP